MLGSLRVLDIVPERAGKRESMEYLRRRFGFPKETTVACGDSGNDVLMMSGETARRHWGLRGGKTLPKFIKPSSQ